MQKAGRLFYDWDQGEEPSVDIDPADFGIDQSARAVPLPAEIGVDGAGEDNTANDVATVAQAAVHAGTEAFAGGPGPTREALIFSVALCLWQVKPYDSVAMAARAAREGIESGMALLRLGRYPVTDTT